MEGRYPKGLIFCNTNCVAPDKEGEFNAWYNRIHLPDVTQPGIFTHGIRYVNPRPLTGQSQYIVTYETEWDDVEKAARALTAHIPDWQKRHRYSPHLEIYRAGPYKKIGGEYRAARRPLRSIIGILANCADPLKESAFNNWYQDVHIPDILDSGLCHTAYRYEIACPEMHEVKPVNGKVIKGKYLAIYETDSDDPLGVARNLRDLDSKLEKQGHGFDGVIDIVYHIAAKRFWP